MKWVVKQEGVQFAIHYLDDYLVIGAPASQECADSLTTLLSVFDRLGLRVAIYMDKLEGPGCQLTFLGFELDSSVLEIRLSSAKLTELQQLISAWVGHKSCSRRELESLVGKLGHATRVVLPGKTFMRRIWLNLAFRSDLL